ncbi:MAG: DUF4157 domain-containing protein, partial [Myxococcales bacterium]|nr:DUF4157 domain-containing protein [Myxococcales bacterium]
MSFDSDAASGPFSAPINSILSESFGQSLDVIDVDRGDDVANDALNAEAYTIGNRISLGSGIREDVNDPHSMEVIAHEVAHALAGGGSGAKMIDGGRDDAGEAGAHAASSQFRDFIAGGGRGRAPRLSPAHGGTAMIHRWEAGEHADAVDHAAQTVTAGGGNVDPAVAAAMARPITLSNGVTVTQGQITAMMGDFYGAYTTGADGVEHFDPMASFNAMDTADPEEMRALVAHIQTEQDSVTGAIQNGTEFEHSDNSELEAITRGRHLQTDEHGTTTGLSFMELAQKNTNHFNSADETSPDSNMGAYGALHAAAIQTARAAADPNATPAEREAAQQRALALEASAQHFETDRFSAGHQFDKDQMVQDNGGGVEGNLRSRVMHDRLNNEGVQMHNGDDSWYGRGDSHWADEENATNRMHSAQATMASYGDITAVMNGDTAAADPANPLATAHQSVPEWNQALNDRTQRQGADLGWGEILSEVSGDVAVAPAMGARWLANQAHSAEDAIGDAATWLSNAPGRAVDWTADALGTVADGASAAWDWTTNAAHTVADGASAAWDATTDA